MRYRRLATNGQKYQPRRKPIHSIAMGMAALVFTNCFSPLAPAMAYPDRPASEWVGAEKGDAVFRDFTLRYPGGAAVPGFEHAGHAGIYLGQNRFTGGGRKFINATGLRNSNPFTPDVVRVVDFEGFKNGLNYWGARTHMLTWMQRNQIVAVALAQQNLPYASFANIKDPGAVSPTDNNPYYYMPGAGVSPVQTSGIGSFRCDGLAEYAYEYAGVDAVGSGTGFFSYSEEALILNINDTGISPTRMFDRMQTSRPAPPEVSGESPSSNSIVSGITTVSCFATDTLWGSGVEKVEFFVDQQMIAVDAHQESIGGFYQVNWDSRNFSNGTRELAAMAYDQAGNYKTYRWTVTVRNSGLPPSTVPTPTPIPARDTTLPTAYIDNPWQDGLFYRGEVIRFFGWANDASGVRSVEVFIDGQSMGNGHYPAPRDDGNKGWWVDWNAGAAPNGRHSILVRVEDNAGNIREVSRWFVVDSIAPVTTVAIRGMAGQHGWMISEVVIEPSATDNNGGSGVNRIEYRLNNGGWVVANGPVILTEERPDNKLEIRAIDNVGNAETVQTFIIKIDRTSPTSTITVEGKSGNNGYYRSAVTVKIAATDNPNGSNVEAIEYRVDDGPWMPYNGPFQISRESANNRVQFRARDFAGNVEAVKTQIIPIDYTPPKSRSTLTGARDMGGLIRSSAKINVYTVDEVSGKDYTSYSLNGQDEKRLVGNEQSFTINGNGASRFAYYGVDLAGNVEEPKDSGPIILHLYAIFAGGAGESLRIMRTSDAKVIGNIHSNGSVELYRNSGLNVTGTFTTVSPSNSITENTQITLASPITTAPSVPMLEYPISFYEKIAAVVFPAPLYLRSTLVPIKDVIYVKGPVYIQSTIASGPATIVAEGPIQVTGTIQTLESADQYNGVMLYSGADIDLKSTIAGGVGLIYAPQGTVRIGSTNMKLTGGVMGRDVEFDRSGTLEITYGAGFPEATYDLPLTSMFLTLPQGNIPALPGAPVLLGPKDKDGVRLSTSLGWNPTPETAGYHAQLSTDSTFAVQSLVVNACTLTPDFSVTLAENKKYYWRCRSVNKAGVGPWSSVATFSTNPVVTTPPTTLVPKITQFTPTSGSPSTIVTITGENLQGITMVKFNNQTATFWGNTATQIVTQVPTGATTGPILVTGTNGTVTSTVNFQVPPKIDFYTPSMGKSGASVVINGSGFTGATSVLFNGKPATFTVNSSTKITAVVPPTATTGPLSVTTPSGTVVAPGQFWVM